MFQYIGQVQNLNKTTLLVGAEPSIPLSRENHMIRHNPLSLPPVRISETGRLGDKTY